MLSIRNASPSDVVEPERRLPVLRDVDVLVVGGGTSGCAAAVAAARRGLRTALLDRYGFLGGTATAAMVGCG
jgi:glycerol-3-phosphate dehydrogenase